MIYTTYFANIRKVREAVLDAVFVSIAGKTPDWADCKKMPKLAPHWDWWNEWHDMFAQHLDSDESVAWYSKKYQKTVLRDLDPLETAREIKDLAEWKPVFLLCYETPEKFCHRHLVSEWLNMNGIECEEWKSSEDKRRLCK